MEAVLENKYHSNDEIFKTQFANAALAQAGFSGLKLMT
jgi:hypothetical protein